MWGYLKFYNGPPKVGDISVKSVGAITTFFIKENGKEVKYKGNQIAGYGLLTRQAYSPFPARLFNSKRPGWLWLVNGDSYIYGDLSIITKASDNGAINKYFQLEKDGQVQEYVETKVAFYGLSGVTIDELTNGGTLTYDEPKKNFRAAQLTKKSGEEYSGWVAYVQDQYSSIFFTSSPEKPIVIQYALEIYDPLDDEFLVSKSIDESAANNGYVITASGAKIEGAISLSFPPKLWFATDVTLTKEDGTIIEYTNDGSLKKVVLTVNGREREFINFENEYVEVLHRYGELVNFRNPHPTTQKVGGEAANILTTAAIESLDQSMLLDIKKQDSDENIDWTQEEVIKLYAEEYMVYNEKTGRTTMYIPGRNYLQVEGDLMGSIGYLTMEKQQRNGYKKMSNPLTTMQYLNREIYSK